LQPSGSSFISSPGQHRLAERGADHDEQLVAVVGNVVTLSGTADVRAEQQEIEIVL